MKNREISRIKRRATKGSWDLRWTETETSLERVGRDLEQIRAEMSERCHQFQQEQCSWGFEARVVAGPPSPLAAQLRQARLCFTGGLSATVIEVLVTGFFAFRYGLEPWFPMLLALLLPLVLKTALATFLHDEERPHETLRRLRLYILGPSLTLFALAVVLLMLARVVGEEFALLLLPVFSLAPLALGIGCLGTAAALFAQWHLLAWSKSAARAYRRREIEETNTVELRRYLLGQQQKLREQQEKLNEQQEQLRATTKADSVVNSKPVQHLQNGDAHGANAAASVIQRFIPLLLFFLPLALSGCVQQLQTYAPPPVSEPYSAPSTTPPPVSPSGIIVINDASRSVNRESRRIAVRNFLHRLPELAESNHALSLEAFVFAQKGWDCESLFASTLPKKPLPANPQPASSGNDLDLLGSGGVSTAVNRRAQNIADEQFRNALARYRAELQSGLAGLTEEQLLNAVPAGGDGSTDLNGVLARVAQLPDAGRRWLVFLITDGVDTRTGKLESVVRPNDAVTLVVILTTNQTGQRADQEYKLRSAQLLKACPWAVVLPYFKDDYQQTLDRAPQPVAPNVTATAQQIAARAP